MLKTWYFPYSAFWSAGQWGGYNPPPPAPPGYATATNQLFFKIALKTCVGGVAARAKASFLRRPWILISWSPQAPVCDKLENWDAPVCSNRRLNETFFQQNFFNFWFQPTFLSKIVVARTKNKKFKVVVNNLCERRFDFITIYSTSTQYWSYSDSLALLFALRKV